MQPDTSCFPPETGDIRNCPQLCRFDKLLVAGHHHVAFRSVEDHPHYVIAAAGGIHAADDPGTQILHALVHGRVAARLRARAAPQAHDDQADAVVGATVGGEQRGRAAESRPAQRIGSRFAEGVGVGPPDLRTATVPLNAAASVSIRPGMLVTVIVSVTAPSSMGTSTVTDARPQSLSPPAKKRAQPNDSGVWKLRAGSAIGDQVLLSRLVRPPVRYRLSRHWSPARGGV